MQQTLFNTGNPPAHKPKAINPQDLNPAQYQAATCVDGPVLVIAGAGSGKTRTLVYRVAHLLEHGIRPENILLLTFTRKSAQEMLHRASLLIDETCRRVLGGTFHAVANLLLRRHSHLLGYTPNFTILDQADSEGIINLIKSSLNLSGAGKRFPSKHVILNILSRAANKNLGVEEILETQFLHLAEYGEDILRIDSHYRKFKVEHVLMDYDDLLLNWRRILTESPQTRQELADRFQYLLVDEYQDTNPIQADIVRLMAQPRNNVMVVGDDSQSIYSFRGADFRNIMDFPKIFPGTRIIRLEENYRSTQNILTVTNTIIELAKEKYTKTLYSKIEGGDKPTIYGAKNEGDQARYIIEKLLARHREGVPFRDMAVLFRSGFHAFKLELELASHRIIFEKRGGQKLTESAHTKDVLAYLRLVTNPQDMLSWNRILLHVDKVGPRTAQAIVERIKLSADPVTELSLFPSGKSYQAQLADLVALFVRLTAPDKQPVTHFDAVWSYYKPIFERIYHDDYPRRSRDLDQLREILAGYADLQQFLDDTALDPPEPSTDDPLSEESNDRLVLSTIHSAKGLEWDTVFVIHLTEGKFPPSQAFAPEQLEEERRLFYVAATRARRRLFFTYPREVMSADRMPSRGEMSPLLIGITPNLLTQTGPDFAFSPPSPPGRYPSKATTTLSTVAPSGRRFATLSNLIAGSKVSHSFFGEGVVGKIVKPKSVEVFFPRHGHKILHLDYARLELIS